MTRKEEGGYKDTIMRVEQEKNISVPEQHKPLTKHYKLYQYIGFGAFIALLITGFIVHPLVGVGVIALWLIGGYILTQII